MAATSTGSLDVTALVVELNDLIRADHDAIRAYRIARARLGDERYHDVVDRFIEDHERHMDEVTRLVRRFGGRPAEPQLYGPGPFELAVEAVATMGGDRAVLLAFKANERRGRDTYRGAAQRAYPPEVTAVLRRAANDEGAHYVWTLETLDDLGVGASGAARRVERAIEVATARASGAFVATERRLEGAAARLRRGLGGEIGLHPLRAALVAVVAGIAAAVVVGSGGGRIDRA